MTNYRSPFNENDPIYLDYNGTTPVAPEVADVMWPYLTKHFGNPSSSHHYGMKPKQAIENARCQVAKMVGCNPDCIVFTSGSTEAINHLVFTTAMKAKNDGKGNEIIITNFEHPATVEICNYLGDNGFKISHIKVDNYGRIDLNELKKMLNQNTILVGVMHSNNEIGTINPISGISQIIKDYNRDNNKDIVFFSDTTQSFGKVNLSELNPVTGLNDIDFITLGSHKIYGPKGIGALYYNKSKFKTLTPFMRGAGQEKGLRPGTESTPLIVGFGKACEMIYNDKDKSIIKYRYLRDLLYTNIVNNIPSKYHNNIKINGTFYTNCLSNTLSISFKNIKNDTIINQFNGQICCSKGVNHFIHRYIPIYIYHHY